MSRIRTLAALFALIAGVAACSPDSGVSPTEPGAQRSPGTALGGKTVPQEPISTANTALTVTLDGPQYVQRNMYCGWSAFPSGGTQPYTYSWTRTGAGSGTAYGDFWEGYIGYGASLMTLTVTVTDADNTQVSATKTVTASPTAPDC